MLIYSDEVKDFFCDEPLSMFTRVEDGWGIRWFPNKLAKINESKVYSNFNSIEDILYFCDYYGINIVIPRPLGFKLTDEHKRILKEKLNEIRKS